MDHMDVKNKVHDVKRTQDPRFLKLFTILAEGDEKARIRSTENLLQQITTKQAATEEGLAKDVEYSVNRLVQGLASSRMFARLGFSVALCQLLRSVDAVTIETVLETIDKKSAIPQDSSKAEAGNAMLGKVFGYLALIQSGRLLAGSKKHVKVVATQLVEMSGEKSYLQLLCANAMVQIIAKVKGKLFKKYILPLIEQQFTAGWGECSADTFLLILISHRHHKEIVADFLKEHWLDEELVSVKNYAHIGDVVMRSTACYPIMHCVIDELVKEVIDRGLNVVKFWKQVVHPLFEVKGAAVPKRAVGVQIFSQLLPVLDTPDKLQTMLSPDVTSVLVRYHPQGKEDLSCRAKDVLSKLTSLAKETSDAAVQIVILRSLIQKPGSHNFDSLTNTSTVANIIAALQPDACVVFVQELMNIFNQNPTWLTAEKADRADVLAWCVTEMVSLVTMGNLPSPWRLSVLQFLLIHGFFKIHKSSGNIPHCVSRREEISGHLQQSIRDNFYKSTSKLLIHHKQGESRVAQFGQSLDILYQLVTYCQTLLDSPTHVQLDVKKFSPEVQEEWTKVVTILKTVDKKRQSEERIKDGHAFELLFIHEGLQLFQDPEGAVDMLQDLYVCYKKSGQRRKSKAKDDEPPWIAVVTEVLLNLMFKDNVLCRNVAKFVMGALADFVTPESLQLIVDALKQSSLDGDDDMIGMEEGESDMEQEDNEEDAEDNKNNKTMVDEDVPSSDSEEEEEEEEDDSEVEEEEVTMADQLKEKVKAALGDAAANSDNDSDDDDDESDADMSDSEMFKLDDVLAEAFRSMRKGKKSNKEKEKQLRIFKQRVLDLVEVLIKQSPSVMLIKMFLVPLVELMEEGSRKNREHVLLFQMFMVPLVELMERGSRKEDDKILGTRALYIYQQLCKQKKVQTEDPQDREDLLAMINQMMTFSKKVASANMVKEVGKGCQQVIRTLLNIHDQTGPSPLKTRAQSVTAGKDKKLSGKKDHDYYERSVIDIIQAGLADMFAHKPGHCPPAFYHMLLERFPMMFWPVYTELLKAIASADIKVYQRTQAALFMATMINSNLVRSLGAEGWNEFIAEYKTTIQQAVTTMGGGEVKVSFVKEILAVVQKIQNISPELVAQLLPHSITTKIDALMPQLNSEVRTKYVLLVKRMKKGKSTHKQSKKQLKKELRKRERAQMAGGQEGATPEKKPRLDNTDDHSDKHNTNNTPEKSDSDTVTSGQNSAKSDNKKNRDADNEVKSNGKVLSPVHKGGAGAIPGDGIVDTPTSKKSKKHKRRKSSQDDSGFLNSDSTDLQSPEVVANGDSVAKKAKVASNGGAVANGDAGEGMTPSRAGKKAKEEFQFSPKYTRSKKRQKDSNN